MNTIRAGRSRVSPEPARGATSDRSNPKLVHGSIASELVNPGRDEGSPLAEPTTHSAGCSTFDAQRHCFSECTCLRHGYIVAAAAACQSFACEAARKGEVTQDRDGHASPPLPVGPRIDASPPLPECPRSCISSPCPADQLPQDYFDTESPFWQPYAIKHTNFSSLPRLKRCRLGRIKLTQRVPRTSALESAAAVQFVFLRAAAQDQS